MKGARKVGLTSAESLEKVRNDAKELVKIVIRVLKSWKDYSPKTKINLTPC